LDVGLVALLYAWQMPHFHSLAFNLKEDYRRGNYKMLVLEPDGEQKVSRTIMAHTLALAPLGVVFWMADITDASFILTSLIPIAWFLRNVRGFASNPTSHPHAKAVFLTSVRFLPLYLLLLLAHHIWHQRQKRKELEA
jgi:protoheme IX farnesyltransferase